MRKKKTSTNALSVAKSVVEAALGMLAKKARKTKPNASKAKRAR